MTQSTKPLIIVTYLTKVDSGSFTNPTQADMIDLLKDLKEGFFREVRIEVHNDE